MFFVLARSIPAASHFRAGLTAGIPSQAADCIFCSLPWTCIGVISMSRVQVAVNSDCSQSGQIAFVYFPEGLARTSAAKMSCKFPFSPLRMCTGSPCTWSEDHMLHPSTQPRAALRSAVQTNREWDCWRAETMDGKSRFTRICPTYVRQSVDKIPQGVQARSMPSLHRDAAGFSLSRVLRHGSESAPPESCAQGVSLCR